jgi:hypothetical protein
MARTPLFGACKRWTSLAGIAERQRRPTREYVEQVWDTWQPTRREVLRVALGTATMAALFLGGRGGIAVGAGTPEARVLETLPQIDAVFPGTAATYCPGRALRMHWPSAPFALGSYAAYRPGQTAFKGIEGQWVGNLHFCGEHTSVSFQGFMEGTCVTGAYVAQAILHDMGLPTAHIQAALGARWSSPQGPVSGRAPQQARGSPHRRLPPHLALSFPRMASP